MIRHIAEHEFETLVIKSNKNLVILSFWAPWCKPCQSMEPIWNSISRRFTTQLDIIKINIDDEERLAKLFNIRSIPTIIFFQKGKQVKMEIGMRDEQYLTGIIAELLKNIK